jgi:hypothetical protein
MNTWDVRYVGLVEAAGGELQPVYASNERHLCSPYCRDGGHAELVYREDDDVLSRELAQSIADLVSPGRAVLEVWPAHEALLPEGFRRAWLVTYGPPRTRAVTELEEGR